MTDSARVPLLGVHVEPATEATFGVEAKQLSSLIDPKSPTKLQQLGGVQGLARALSTDLSHGLEPNRETVIVGGRPAPFAFRKQLFGKNVLPEVKSKSIFVLMWEALHDRTLIMLSIAAVISLAIGIYEDITIYGPRGDPQIGWIEGCAIIIAVLVVVTASSFNDYQKEKQFRQLNAKKEDRLIEAIREGQQMRVSIYDICVGDVLLLATGDVICADGVLIEGYNLRCDESGMTGESDAIKKNLADDPFLLSGTKVLEGVGRMLVIAVGPNSMHGRAMLSLRVEPQDTPLQIKLADLAETIAKLGLACAILILIILLVKYFIQQALKPEFPPTTEVFNSVIKVVIQAITIVVVAVPEGLPMAVTLALAYSTVRMLKDNNLVRVLAACETMGGATTVCSDKTGTLTQNRMTVVRGTIFDLKFDLGTIAGLPSQIASAALEILAEGICVNATAYEGRNERGEKTECALLGFANKLGGRYQDIRESAKVEKMYPFSSDRKRMSTVIRLANGDLRLYCKGASEIIVKQCTAYIAADGTIWSMTAEKRDEMDETILRFANDGLRTICLAYRDFGVREDASAINWDSAPDDSLVCIGIVGIEDPLRPEVHDAVQMCQGAGIVVRMVTGDNIMTARNIAKQCGILTKGGIIMEGPEFRNLSPEHMERILPNLQVLARSSPMDKQILVGRLQQLGEVVAVTGDGTNDGPALKLADVGFSMGIAGTEVAKEASDIVLMDDNFSSLVKAIMWGRNVFDSVRKFLQFQLTVNMTAVTLAFVSAVLDEHSTGVLTAVQLLWINLIMDTMAALALATEPPTVELLQRKPHGRRASLISPKMWKMIIGMSIYQVVTSFLLLYLGPTVFHLDTTHEHGQLVNRTIVFTAFVFSQLFNEINCRRVDDTLNAFTNIHNHHYFVVVMAITVPIQVLVVQYGGVAFQTAPLTLPQWTCCVLIGALSLPIAVVIRLMPDCFSEPTQPEPVVLTRERLMWQNAIRDVQTQIRVVNALRRQRRG